MTDEQGLCATGYEDALLAVTTEETASNIEKFIDGWMEYFESKEKSGWDNAYVKLFPEAYYTSAMVIRMLLKGLFYNCISRVSVGGDKTRQERLRYYGNIKKSSNKLRELFEAEKVRNIFDLNAMNAAHNECVDDKDDDNGDGDVEHDDICCLIKLGDTLQSLSTWADMMYEKLEGEVSARGIKPNVVADELVKGMVQIVSMISGEVPKKLPNEATINSITDESNEAFMTTELIQGALRVAGTNMSMQNVIIKHNEAVVGMMSGSIERSYPLVIILDDEW